MKTKVLFLLVAAYAWLHHTEATAAAYRNRYGQLPANATPGDRMFAEYFRSEARTLAERSLAEVRTIEDWNKHKVTARQQLLEMLGLDPLPPKTDLKATVTGTLDHPDFTVEKLHFQSRPGLYVTANVYVPKKLSAPAPAILYVCGHAVVKTNGVSYGNKVGYQHWGAWFARNGYVCMWWTPSSLAKSRASTTARTARTCGGGTRAATPVPEPRRGTASARWTISSRARMWTARASG